MALLRRAYVLVELELMDRVGRTAETSFRLSSGLSLGQLSTSAAAVVTAIEGISSCLVAKMRFIWQYVEDEPSIAPDESDARLFLSLFYTNATDMFAFDIPSPRPELFITTGKYAGLKVDLRNPAVAAILDPLTIALEATVNALGEDRDPVLVTGGKM